MRKLTALLIASSLAMGVSLVRAEEGKIAPAVGDDSKPMMKHHMGHKGGDRGSEAFAGIKLTETQRQQMRELKQQLASTFPSQDDIGKQRASLHSFMVSDQFDEAAVRSQLDANSKTNNEFMLKRIKIRNQMYNLLTPEQKKQFNANYEKRMQEIKAKFAEKSMSMQD